MSLTDDDVAQIRGLIRDELRAAGLPGALTFAGEGKRVTVLNLPEQTIYSGNDILTPEVLDHIEMVVMSRLVHAITTRRTDPKAW
jgi:hypothetical protein